jgi:streptogramin lyase
MYTRVVRLVPGSTVVDQITMRGLLENASANDITVLRDGRILVATYAHGIVAVNPADGAQSIYRSTEALGGHVAAMTLDASGELLILINAGTEGRILRDDPESGLEVLAAGSDLYGGADLVRSPGGELFVALPGAQSVVRLSPQGARLAVYASDAFRGPSQLAVTGNGRLYASNGGIMAAGYGGCVTRTEIATGVTVSAVGANASEGVAVVSPERVFYSTKTTDPSGEHWSLHELSAGWQVADVTGPMVSVTEEPVPVHTATWGAVKRTYR